MRIRMGGLLLIGLAAYGQQFPRSTDTMIKMYWAPATTEPERRDL